VGLAAIHVLLSKKYPNYRRDFTVWNRPPL
jgi:hypothetical protein